MSRYSVDISANLHGFEKLDAVESQIKQLNGSKIKIDIDLTSAQTALKNFQNQLKNSKFTISPIIGNTGQYKQAGQQIGQLISSEAEKAIKNVTSKEIKVPFSVDISKSSKFQSEMENLVKKWTNGKGQLTNVNVQTKTAYDETSAQNIEKLNKATLTYKNSLNEVVQKTVEWKQIGTTIDANGNTKALMGFVESGSRYSKAMDNASKSTQTLISDIRRLSLANSIEKWNQKNTAATKECIATNEEYIHSLRDLDNVMSQEQYNKINLGFKQNETSMRGLGRLGASLRQQFSDAANSFGQWMSVSTSVMTLIYQIQKIPKEVYAVDTAMTNLYKVTDETQSRYDSFLDNAGKKAQDLGTTMSDLINQTADWTKLGYSLDESEILSNLSSIYQNVGEVDSSTAVSDMVTAMKAFNIEASNAVTIIDQLNALGKNVAQTYSNVWHINKYVVSW